MSLAVPHPQQTHPRNADMLKPTTNNTVKFGIRPSQFAAPQFNNNNSTIPPAVDTLVLESTNSTEYEEEVSFCEHETLSYYGLELQAQLQQLLNSLTNLKYERSQLQGKVQNLERALFDEIESAQETLTMMDTANTRLESRFIKLSQWNTVIGFGASLLGLTCVFLAQQGAKH